MSTIKTIAAVAALLASTALPASADGYQYDYGVDGQRYVQTCTHSAYGVRCWGAWNPEGINARVVHVPANAVHNEDPNWARGCRSCVDLSREK